MCDHSALASEAGVSYLVRTSSPDVSGELVNGFGR
jgi:hypothetical protein